MNPWGWPPSIRLRLTPSWSGHVPTNKAVLGAAFDRLLLTLQTEQDRMCERGLLDVDPGRGYEG